MFSKLIIAYRFCVVYVRKTNKMHTFLNNLFQLNYPRHVSNKYFFIIRRSVQAAYSILSCILMRSLVADSISFISTTLITMQGELL